MGPIDYYQNYYGQQNQNQPAQQYTSYNQQSSSTATQQYSQQYSSQSFANNSSGRTNTYGQNQAGWNDSYSNGQESTGRAAEALQNLSNPAYSTGTGTAVSSPAIANATTTTASRYGSNTQAHATYNTVRTNTQTPPNAGYQARVPRPASVNQVSIAQRNSGSRHGLPLPNTSTYPSQTAYAAAAAVGHAPLRDSTQRTTNSTTSYDQSRTLPTVNYSAQNTPSNPYAYSDSAGDNHTGSATTNDFGQTVDPIAVYDPWPEIQRKQAAAKAAAKAEAERQEREAEEQRARKAAAAEKQLADELEAKRLQEEVEKEEKKRKRAEARKKKAAERSMAASVAQLSTVTTPAPAEGPVDEEAQIRELMAKMRQFNSKNPSLLAKIWEEERKGNASQSPKPPPKTLPQREQSAAAASPVVPAARPVTQTPIPLPGSTALKGKGVASQAKPTSTAVQSPVMTSKPQGGAVWPPEKREALASAAAKWLNGLRGNESLQITSRQICDRLDQNPTYIELCEWFESRGMALERASFARHLLEAVPDVNQSSRAAPKTTQKGPAKQTPIPTPVQSNDDNGSSSRIFIQAESNDLSNGNQSAYPMPDAGIQDSPYFTPELPALPNIADADTPDPAPIANMKGSDAESKPSPAMTKPISKEEAARKKNFSDLIDLTQLSDDDLPRPVQRPAFEASSLPHRGSNSVSASFDTPSLVQHQSSYQQPPMPTPGPSFAQYQPSTSHAFVVPPVQQPYRPQQPPASFRPIPGQFNAPPSGMDNRAIPMDVVKPLDGRNKALRRSTYDSKTIARDVLITTGKHPEMRALNAHLDVLKTTFRMVDNSSDLSTFRWDLVDPGQPPKEMLSGGQELDFADDEDEDDDDVNVARPRPMMTQSIPATGGGSIATMSFGSSLPQVKVPKKRGRPRQSYPQSSRLAGFADGFNTQHTPFRQNAGNSTNDRPHSSEQSHNISRTPASAPPARSTAAVPGSGAASGTGYSAFREYAPDGTPLPKKRGRPVGWRKAIHGSGAAQATRSVNRYTAGQQSALRNVTSPAEPLLVDSSPSPGGAVRKRHAEHETPEYKVYKCKWQHCSAELHNLDTLRKHVFKLHNKQAAHGGFDCLWSGCGQKVKSKDRRTGEESVKHQYFDFSKIEEWQTHIEQAHLSNVAWQQGDGPASGVSDAEMSEAYLSDNQGRRVTPRVTAPADQSPAGARAAGTPRRPGRPPKKSVENEARDAQRELEARKRAIGPGIDRGGARLANEKRRMGFVDDDDSEMAVDMDD